MATGIEDKEDDATLGLAVTPRERAITGQAAAASGNVDRYVMLEQLGAGGMGVVHRAYDPKLRREVAIKMLRFDRRDGSGGQRAETRILREAQAMAQLSHPNVLPVYDVEHVSGSVYIAMEYVDGETLSRWMRRGSHTWKEVLELLIPAGRGLQAAHQAGIIHRDFKPSNVLLGNKGRVLVTDFGLARARDEQEDPKPDDDEAPKAWTSSKIHDLDSITEVGEVVGTPAYMAPEQLRGDPVDASADQYAFCVAVYEGLFGRRPFGARDQRLLLMAKEAGKVEADPSAHVPTWLFRIVERGMAPRPGDRFDSMTELLQCLSRDPSQLRRRWVWVGSGAVLSAAAIGLRLAAGTDEPPCPEPAELVDRAWEDERRDQVQAALLATGQSYAAETAERVTQLLGNYAQAWAEGHVDACEATHVRHDQSAEAFDLRMSCLRRHQAEFDTTVETLTETVSVGTLRRATRMAAALPSVGDCTDVEALRSRGRPTDPKTAAEAERQRQTLARARVLLRAGRNDEAEPLAIHVEARGDELRDPVLRGEARLLRGRIHVEDHQLTVAEHTLRNAFADAVEGRDSALAVDSALRLASVLGVIQARTAEAEQWAEQARAWLRGSARDDPRYSELQMIEAGILQVAGRLDEARVAFSRGAVLMEERPQMPDPALAHHNLGLALMVLGDVQEARKQFETELALLEVELGPHHPEVARALQSLGATLYLSGQLAQAVPHFERALDIREAALGPDHPKVAAILDNLGSLRDDLGEHDEARELLERALQIFETVDAPGSNAVIRIRGNLAQVLRHAGEYEAAARQLRQIGAIIEAEHGPAHPDRIDLMARLGEIFLEAGELPKAHEVLEQANELRPQLPTESALVSADVARTFARVLLRQGRYESAQGLLSEAVGLYQALGEPLDARRGEALLDLGTALLADGDAAAARGPLEAAIPLLTTPQVSHTILAKARFTLARAIVASGARPEDRPRAERLARDARMGLLDDDSTLSQVDAWLEDQGLTNG